MATVQRRLSVIVCADVVGYSRLMGSDELGTLTALKGHREAIDPLFAEEGGRLVKTTGDGLLLEFPSAFHAVRASLGVQRLMAERNIETPADKRLVFRMGIHLGDVIVDNDDIFGDGVNIAARLQEIAEPGGICLSQAVHATIHKNIDALFNDGGQKVLKNIAAPVHVYNLALSGASSAPAAPNTGPLLSLVVLPFINLSGDARHDFLVDSITDQLTTELARIDGSFVVNRKTALAYRGDGLDVSELGLELGVRFVIKGNVRSGGAGMRVGAQLFDAESGQPIWVDRFDIAVDDPFPMQHEAVARLIPALHAQLLAASGRAPQPAPEMVPPQQTLVATPSGGAVMHPRGASPSAPRRVAANVATRPATGAPPPRAETPRPSPAARPTVTASATPELGRSLEPRPRPVRRRKPFQLPLWLKLAVVVIAGVVALALLGPDRRSMVEIVSWMLIAAGTVQMIGVLAGSGRRG
jgi:class 3 adenylate cyclase/TolB-like protein